jgi:hypothetical protein
MGAPEPVQLLTALTTEHFTLQGARSQTMSETSARASIYMFSVSSALVALGFVSQVGDGAGAVFDGGAVVALALGAIPDLPVWLATVVGVIVAAASIVGWVRRAGRILDTAARQVTPRSPTPSPLPSASHSRVASASVETRTVSSS